MSFSVLYDVVRCLVCSRNRLYTMSLKGDGCDLGLFLSKSALSLWFMPEAALCPCGLVETGSPAYCLQIAATGSNVPLLCIKVSSPRTVDNLASRTVGNLAPDAT